MQANDVAESLPEGAPTEAGMAALYAAFYELDPAGLDIAINQNWPE